jgi:hypothetical protein
MRLNHHIQIRVGGAWHTNGCLVIAWTPRDHHEPWCTCRLGSHLCPFCEALSHSVHDGINRYCGQCHTFADDRLNLIASDPATYLEHIHGCE